MMKKVFVLAFLMLGIISVQAIAQEASEEITEEEMMKFAVMEESTAAYLQQKQSELEEMIKNDETLGGAARYNQIKGAWGNEDKLAEIEITEEETEAYEKIQGFIEGLGKDVVKYKTELIMDPEVLGAATYNKVKKAMDADPAVKEQIDNLISELKEKRASENDGVTE